MKCPECGAKMILRNSKYGKFYGCSTYPTCKATHGAHPNGKPLGFPANKKLKKLRILAHEELDKCFYNKAVMYKWLKKHTKTGHVGSMNESDIQELIIKLARLHKEG